MHVLRQIHTALKRNGLLLDIHPLPEDPVVDVVRGGRSTRVGTIDWEQDSREIRAARRQLAFVQREQLFRLERRRFFEIRMYHNSVKAWLDYRTERGATSVIHDDLLSQARKLMRTSGSKLVITERVRASTLRRA